MSEYLNSELEELVLFGKSRRDVIAAGIYGHSGSVSNPVNTTEKMLSSLDVIAQNDPELKEIFAAIDNLATD